MKQKPIKFLFVSGKWEYRPVCCHTFLLHIWLSTHPVLIHLSSTALFFRGSQRCCNISQQTLGAGRVHLEQVTSSLSGHINMALKRSWITDIACLLAGRNECDSSIRYAVLSQVSSRDPDLSHRDVQNQLASCTWAFYTSIVYPQTVIRNLIHTVHVHRFKYWNNQIATVFYKLFLKHIWNYK